MLIEIYLFFLGLAFLFMLLSFMPVGEKGKVSRKDKDGEMALETQQFVVLFPWFSMGLFFILSFMSMDIEIVTCSTIVDQVNSTVANIDTLTSSWSCYSYPYYSDGLIWLNLGMAVMMLILSVLATFLFAGGGLMRELNRMGRNKSLLENAEEVEK